ncbi:MAG TPA: diguanylate cyclase [Desulfosporosinus sp.]|nr:diguanylate cyclase [Desulfosporosinus sp.]
MNKKLKELRVLICDDDPEDRKLIQTYFWQKINKGTVTIEAGQAADIEIALSENEVDLVLMDIQMPEKSGMDWLAEIVQRHVAPVLMLTGCGNEETAVKALEQGAIGYLPKNKLTADKLIDAVDAAMKKWKNLELSRETQEKLEKLANVDPLTGLLNRRAILNKLEESIKHSRRYETNLSVIMLDIDHFKEINDSYGHFVGDHGLKRIALFLQRKIRDTDVAGRLGGDEFLIVLPKAIMSSALTTAERIRENLANTKMRNLIGDVFSMTVSQGVASYKPGDSVSSLVSRSDAAMYRAKQNGRNRVEKCERQSLRRC